MAYYFDTYSTERCELEEGGGEKRREKKDLTLTGPDVTYSQTTILIYMGVLY